MTNNKAAMWGPSELLLLLLCTRPPGRCLAVMLTISHVRSSVLEAIPDDMLRVCELAHTCMPGS